MGKAILLVCLLCWVGSPGVSTAGEVTETELHESLVAYVASRAPTGVEIVQWELRRGEPLPLMGRIAGVEIASGAEWHERTPLRVQVETDSGPQRTLWVNATLRRARPVVVATRNLPIGHLIRTEDVSTEVREGWGRNEDLYAEAGDVVGKRVWRPVSKGACVKSWHVRDRKGMGRGDAVSIVAQTGSVRVEAPGQLLEAGNPGDRVRVLNVASGREVFATVLDAHTVAVSY